MLKLIDILNEIEILGNKMRNIEDFKKDDIGKYFGIISDRRNKRYKRYKLIYFNKDYFYFENPDNIVDTDMTRTEYLNDLLIGGLKKIIRMK